ncbi:hypothetical protein EDB89DRAFT_1948987 [Lactarius sanguifluus]|nr:hypothetical protein EDB89DRAFT_1948987 [Lactarius sanguifluus]
MNPFRPRSVFSFTSRPKILCPLHSTSLYSPCPLVPTIGATVPVAGVGGIRDYGRIAHRMSFEASEKECCLRPLSFLWVSVSSWSQIRGDRTTDLLIAAPLVGSILLLTARLAQSTFRNLPPVSRGLLIIGDVLHIADQDWVASPCTDKYGDITPNASRN